MSKLIRIPLHVEEREERIIVAAIKLKYGEIRGNLAKFTRASLLQASSEVVRKYSGGGDRENSLSPFRVRYAFLCRSAEYEPTGGIRAAGIGITRIEYRPNVAEGRGFSFVISVEADNGYVGKSVPASFVILADDNEPIDEVIEGEIEFCEHDDGDIRADIMIAVVWDQDAVSLPDGRYWTSFTLEGLEVARIGFVLTASSSS